MASAKNKKSGGHVEQIHDDDEPPPVEGMFGEVDPNIAAAKKNRGNVEEIHDDTHPDARSSMSEDTSLAKKLRTAAITTGNLQSQHRNSEDSILVPTQEEMEMDSEPLSTVRTLFTLRGAVGHQPGSEPGSESRQDEDALTHDIEEGQQESLPQIPEAFLVEERSDVENNIVIAGHAEPLIPWYKQKRIVCPIIACFLIAVAITAGAATSLNRSSKLDESDAPSLSPSKSSEPTLELSGAPSSSLAPSSSPTACSLTISSSRQMLDLPVDYPTETIISMEGRDAIVVTRDATTGNVHIIFFQLKENGWVRGNHFIEQKSNVVDVASKNDPRFEVHDKVSVAFNGKVAFIGAPYSGMEGRNSGAVFIYNRDDLGVWEKRDEALKPQDGDSENIGLFGYSVGMDGDLACVLSDGDFQTSKGAPRVYIFLQEEGNWIQKRRIDLPFPPEAQECYVAGDTVAVQINSGRIDVYQYNAELDTYQRIQAPIKDYSMESVSFSQNHLLYSYQGQVYGSDYDTDGNGCYFERYWRGLRIFHRQDLSHLYTIQQEINLTNYDCVSLDQIPNHWYQYHRASFSHDTNIVVTGDTNQTKFFVKNSANDWKEALTLDEEFLKYDVYGRDLLAVAVSNTSNHEEVYHFNLEDCEASPTYMPSLSTAPTSSVAPSSLPTYPNTKIPPVGIALIHYAGTAAPTATRRPSIQPSQSIMPSTTTKPTLSPSVSYSPTNTCYWIEVEMYFTCCRFPFDSYSWDIQAILGSDGSLVSYKSSMAGPYEYGSTWEHACLEEGDYLFTLNIGDYAEGSYLIATDGVMIAEGGLFQHNQTTMFSVPVELPPTPVPTTYLPTTSLWPTLPPGSTYSPTATQPPSFRGTPFPTELYPSTWPPGLTPFPTEPSVFTRKLVQPPSVSSLTTDADEFITYEADALDK